MVDIAIGSIELGLDDLTRCVDPVFFPSFRSEIVELAPGVKDCKAMLITWNGLQKV